MFSVGIDVGGTFTDIVAYDHATGRYRVHKLPSTPGDPMLAMVRGVAETGVAAADIAVFAHGTTVATNAVIQKAGARTGLITTKGFRDVLQLRRTNRADVYNLQWTPPRELVPRDLRVEVAERTAPDGTVLERVAADELRRAVCGLVEQGVKAIAVAFLHSYANPANERAARELIEREFPGLDVCVSSDVLPEWREFERTSTTVVNAYLLPVVGRYLESLERKLEGDGYTNDVFVMLSNGGLSTAQVARSIPAHTLASGPAGGVIAETSIAGLCGEPNIVGLDIGGTSADVSVVRGGKPTLTADQQVEFGAPVRLPSIEVISIGAGGGSIAWIDSGGGLHVGPRSAGAEPGPACYGRGGQDPTVTDANVVLGRLNPRSLLGGTMEVFPALARRSIEERVAGPLGLSLEQAAWGILEIVNQNMINAIRQVTIQRGIDPREFSLFGYGGAGPLHAAQIARELGMPRVIVPAHPGVTSALGLLMADIRHDFCRTFLRVLDAVDYGSLERTFAELECLGAQRLSRERVSSDRVRLVRGLDLRYVGQTHELSVEVPGGCTDRASLLNGVRGAFRGKHVEEFGFAKAPDFPIEIVNVRLAAIGLLPKVDPVPARETRSRAWNPTSVRPALFDAREGYVDTPVFDRRHIPEGADLKGPAVIEQFDSTTVVMPGQVVRLDGNGNLVITAA